MRLAYADPPYFGCCRRYGHRHEPPWGCWDDLDTHQALIGQLTAYHGWAMSCGSSQLATMLPLCPAGVRVAAWCKPFSAAFPTVRVSYAWEPVLYGPARPLTRGNDAQA